MIELCGRFACAADEVWRLQRGSEADCVLFQRMVNGGERITDRGTRQGLWVLAPGGAVLGRCNTRDPERVLEVLERALAAWAELDEEARRLPAGVALEPAHRWEQSWPEGGLVLERVARELGAEDPATAPLPAWNRDFVWFAREELRGLVPSGAALGDSLELPRLIRRLARFHLVDNVRGQTVPYADEEVLEARLTAEVVAREGPRVELVLSGETRAAAGDEWLLGENLWKPAVAHPHGIECRLLGRARFDLEHERFEGFELVAVARRWGRTVNNGRGRDDTPGRLAFHLGLAPASARLAPTFVALYDAGWIAHPAVPTWRESPVECGLEAR